MISLILCRGFPSSLRFLFVAFEKLNALLDAEAESRM
jgi:hypothetical protein